MSPSTKILTLAASAVLSLGVLSAPPAQAAQKATHYRNCTAMHRVWHHGVAVSARASRRDGHGAPVRPRVYQANKGSDRDKDGVACEA